MANYDPLIDILEYAAESCEQQSNANAPKNLQAVLRADEAPSLEHLRRTGRRFGRFRRDDRGSQFDLRQTLLKNLR